MLKRLLALTVLALAAGALPASVQGAPDAAACPPPPAAAASPCPKPPVPTEPRPPSPSPSPPPSPLRSYIGALGTSAWTDRLRKPRRLVPCSADGGCQVIRTRWRHWGRATATGRGRAKINDCRPNCAAGRFHTTRGARVRAYRRRAGTCNGAAARFYTRVRITWPPRLHRHRTTLKLARSCV